MVTINRGCYGGLDCCRVLFGSRDRVCVEYAWTLLRAAPGCILIIESLDEGWVKVLRVQRG